jgi:hypothetical protein
VVGVTRKVCEIGLGQASVWNLDRSMATARAAIYRCMCAGPISNR